MWRTIGTFTVRDGPEGDRQVRACVARIARRLALPAAFLKQIQSAVTRATLNAAHQAPGSPTGSSQRVEVRVLVSKGGPAGADPSFWPDPSPPGLTSLASKRAGQAAFRGWGFFLIEQPAGETQSAGDAPDHRIELFLYPEGGQTSGQGR